MGARSSALAYKSSTIVATHLITRPDLASFNPKDCNLFTRLTPLPSFDPSYVWTRRMTRKACMWRTAWSKRRGRIIEVLLWKENRTTSRGF